ncbi:hypothetical protein E2C01_005645 [Portunus trituberculatus]|uniref:Uncharacterized protein n=1 Tax=Portunus trituberculatus TaxID=210409 RepID=A0A5B7CU09_PORTR|nr:hypothetical protein [Portunus trituberculatus]
MDIAGSIRRTNPYVGGESEREGSQNHAASPSPFQPAQTVAATITTTFTTTIIVAPRNLTLRQCIFEQYLDSCRSLDVLRELSMVQLSLNASGFLRSTISWTALASLAYPKGIEQMLVHESPRRQNRDKLAEGDKSNNSACHLGGNGVLPTDA